jgi:hypothetical protein
LGKEQGFMIQKQWLEVLGICQECQEDNQKESDEPSPSETKPS